MKRMVFRIGASAGFYSEYLGMLYVYCWCLERNIEFHLFSKDANFSYECGWSDYFIPFCQEDLDVRHSTYNMRLPFPSLKFIIKSIYRRLFYGLPIRSDVFFMFKFWNVLSWKINERLFRKEKGIDYLTYDLFWKAYKEYFDRLDVHGQLLKEALNKTYRYNTRTLGAVNKLIAGLDLPSRIIAIHIRGGDKVTEEPIIADVRLYLNEISKISSGIKDVFVFTDDYSYIERLNECGQDMKFYTLCGENERGYDNNDFCCKERTEIKNGILKLFANIEILTNADYFIGVKNSNPDYFLDIRRVNNTIFLDKK